MFWGKIDNRASASRHSLRISLQIILIISNTYHIIRPIYAIFRLAIADKVNHLIKYLQMLIPRSMTGRLTVVILTASLLPIVIIAWVAFNALFEATRNAKIDDVGNVASIRHEQLTFALNRSRSRALLFLTEQQDLCKVGNARPSPQVLACLRASLNSFVHTERALGGMLIFPGMAETLNVGQLAGLAFPAMLPGQLAVFPAAEKQENRGYQIPVSQQKIQLVITYPVSLLQDIFLPPSALGESGETFLADAKGFFVTHPRYHSVQGHHVAISAVPMQTCLARQNSELLELDYRGMPIIHGFRYIPEIGGGCIMAHFDQHEAFAALDRLKFEAVMLVLLVAFMAVSAAIYFGRQLSRPLNSLSAAIAQIENGSENICLGEYGSREIAMLTEAFKHMLVRLKNAAHELRASEQRSSLLLESVSNGIWGLDRTGKTTFVNLAAADMLGYSQEELANKPMHDTVHHSHQDGTPYPLEHCPMYATLLDGQPRTGKDEVLWRRDGRCFPVEFSAYPLFDNDIQVGVVVVLQDITERKLAEQHAQEQQSRLSGLIDSAMDAIVSTDENQRITLFNHAAEQVFGYRAADIIGQSLERLIPERYRATHGRHVAEFGRTGMTARSMNVPGTAYGVRASGEEFPFEASISQVEVAGRRIYTAILRDITQRWQTERKIRESQVFLMQSEERLQQAVSISGIGMFDHDHLTDDVYCSPQMREIFGLAPDEPVRMQSLLACIYPPDSEQVYKAIEHAQDAAGDGRFSLSHRIVRRDGVVRWLAVQFQTSFAGEGESRYLLRTIGAIRDITRRKQSEEGLQLAASVYQASNEAILVTDENNLIVEINPAFTQLTGYTLDEVRGKNPREFQSGKHDQKFYQEMWWSIIHQGHWQGEVWDKRRDGELHAKWLSISVIRREDGSIFRYLGQFSDITDKKRKDDLIWTQANFDALTDLPNRRLLADRIHQAMSSGMRTGRYGALISLDLDQFKQLNDTLGHSMGDKLLIEVARRLQACIRKEDTVARMGGDEFLVVLTEMSGEPGAAAIQAEQIAEKIRSELCRPYQLGMTEHHSSSSFGIVLFRGNQDSQENLLAHVDAAMYQAKARGRNTVCFFDQTMQAALEKRGQLESALRVALARRELSLYYQLQVNERGQAVGAEALLRWNHPVLGMVSPAQFIPVAEETGLILSIGQWVLETACAQLAEWQTDPQLCQLSIAVNVSARQFREATYVAHVREVLDKTAINPAVLKLELTESLVLDNVDDSICKMQELKKLGIKFSMDDFGTGYSSLAYLSRLPIDQLKIDQSFVRDITTDPNDAAIVQTIISMAHSLKMEVIAEGVETQEQREFLESRGCLFYQGYFYARPLPIAEVAQKLTALL